MRQGCHARRRIANLICCRPPGARGTPRPSASDCFLMDDILVTEKLTKEFHGFVAVNNVDLRVRRGTTLALDPELLLLDEPTQGMGHEDVGRVTALIEKVARKRTVLMVEHNLSVV